MIWKRDTSRTKSNKTIPFPFNIFDPTSNCTCVNHEFIFYFHTSKFTYILMLLSTLLVHLTYLPIPAIAILCWKSNLFPRTAWNKFIRERTVHHELESLFERYGPGIIATFRIRPERGGLITALHLYLQSGLFSIRFCTTFTYFFSKDIKCQCGFIDLAVVIYVLASYLDMIKSNFLIEPV